MRRDKFSLSNYKLTTGNMGQLIPVGLIEILPGDTFQHATSTLIRVNPLLAPVMHPTHATIHHWFVPTRLLWANGIDDSWEAFITGGHDGLDASVAPTITPNTGTGYAVGSLADYLGVPTGVDDLPHSALPFRAYALIWNEFYRDQDLQTALTIDLTGGADTTTNVTLQNVCWEKDYFTTARPWTQKGPAVSLPLGTSATVKTAAGDLVTGAANKLRILDSAIGDNPTDLRYLQTGGGSGNNVFTTGTGGTSGSNGIYPTNLYADLSGATAATINELREAFAIQSYEEARARYGSRYTEYLRYLGVKSSDARLQRPEYLGGGKETLQWSEVLQTGVTTSGAAAGVGNLKGHGIGAIRSNRYRRFFEEHGYVVSLLSVKPKTIYTTGLPRMWSRATKEDYFQKELQFIGQQAVLNKELYWADTGPNDTFGYQDRYDEYRRVESTIGGEFRSAALNFWHMGRIFAGDVTLNAAFVSADPTTRIYQSTATHQLQIMAMHSIQARRIISQSARPHLVG